MKNCFNCGTELYDNEKGCYKCGIHSGFEPHNFNNSRETDVTCPKCGSHSVQGYKRGFSAGKGCLGFLLMLPLMIFTFIPAILGLIFGGAAGANKVKRVCLNCGKKW